MILDTLGTGGLAQQVKATDEGGKTLLMYAARCADVVVFQLSCGMVREFLTEPDDHYRLRDDEGRTLLHHAAEAASNQVVAEVMYSVNYKRV